MKLHLLDMGDEKYGDAIVVVLGERRILIDGAHIRDFEQRFAAPSLPDQLRDVLGGEPPFRMDLLVVTHCHGDHIGCLPTLVADGIVEADWALLAHEDLGYPDSDGGLDAPDPVIDKVVAGLREEPRDDFASDAELDAFLTDAANLEQRYRTMVKALENAGTRVIRFAGTDDDDTAGELTALIQEFADFDFQILGPTQRHVLLCTDAIVEFTRAAKKAAKEAAKKKRPTDIVADAAAIYRSLAGERRATDAAVSDDITQFLDRPGKGAALNDQSIVLKLGKEPNAMLLTGDMQLAAAEIAGLDDLMAELLEKIVDAGPYAFVKLAHHASYNGFDEKVLEGLRNTKVFGVTTGRGDPGHPHEDVLALLKTVKGQSHWVRTDKNGLVTLDIRNGEVDIQKSRGRLDDPSINREDVALSVPVGTQPSVAQPAGGSAVSRRVTQTADGEVVEVTARIPHVRTRVTITVEVEPGGAVATPQGQDIGDDRNEQSVRLRDESPPPLAAGRELPSLLFVTNGARLEKNIGKTELQRVVRIIKSANQPLVEITRPDDPFPEVRAAIGKHTPEGVVVLGGYDVLKAIRYDSLPADLRARLGDNADPDDFIVWSDQAYGDRDGDMLGELPVSRIPDGHSPDLMMAALCTCAANPRAQRFGLRNYARPFAENIFNSVPGSQAIMVSFPTKSKSVNPGAVDANAIYLMLHGSDIDGTRFWGELDTGGIVEALHVGNIPNPCGGTVLSGCCWGALTVRTPALKYTPGDPIQSVTPAQSIALNFLLRGARAFVGCTGAHYSPVDEDPLAPLNHFGAPMHAAFWSHLLNGNEPPARALFKAKMDYIRDMPHGRPSVEEQAIEYKILRQFTCLGLGW